MSFPRSELLCPEPPPLLAVAPTDQDKSMASLFALQYVRSPLPNNRTANALVLIDGGLDCSDLEGVLPKDNLRLLRLVRPGLPGTEAREFSFAEPHFVATVMLDEADVFRVHIAEPVSQGMSDCDGKLVEFLRQLVVNLVSQITGREMKVMPESGSGSGWHTCVPCLIECRNIHSFLRHALQLHDLRLPSELSLPSSCSASAFGPLLVLRSDARPRLHILRTLVALKLVRAELSPPVTSSDALLRLVAEMVKGVHCAAHPVFVAVCADCNHLLNSKLSRHQEAMPASVLACLPDLVSLKPPPPPADDDPPPGRHHSKPLKCPMCNWTYKYRETLEQHWRDKHGDAAAETELACVHCRSGGQHPKLAKGEAYPCGYAAYHCHFCGYKTNTKGNLEIHKQSEKHLHNVQKHRGLVEPTPPLATPLATPLAPPGEVERPAESLPTEFSHHGDLLRCFVCGAFATGSLQAMVEHVSAARDVREEEYIYRAGEPQQTVHCRLCPYKTGVKANFAVHCNTEKHRQKVSLLAHMYAGDRKRLEGVDWATRLANMSPVQILCTACQSIETSVAAMERHLKSDGHADAFNTLVFLSQRVREVFGRRLDEHSFVFECRACLVKLYSVSEVRAHMASVEHASKAPQVPRSCQTKPNFLQTMLSISLASNDAEMKERKRNVVQCPCCAEQFPDTAGLKIHLRLSHNIDESRVDLMCQMATTLDLPASPKPDKEELLEDLKEKLRIVASADDETADAFIGDHTADKQIYTCDVCYRDLTGHVALLEHLAVSKHGDVGLSDSHKYLCWKKGCNQYFDSNAMRERHLQKIHTSQYQADNSIFAFPCRTCGLAFRAEPALTRHAALHQRLVARLGGHACTVCHARGPDLRRHVLTAHCPAPEVKAEVNGAQESTSPSRAAAGFALAAATPYTCTFCNIGLPSLAAYKVHEQTLQHRQRLTALLLSSGVPPLGVLNGLPMPLGMGPLVGPHLLMSSLLEASLARREEAEKEASPAVSPALPGKECAPPTTPTSASSSSSLAAPGLVSPVPNLLSPLAAFPPPAAFPAPSPAAPEPSRRRGRTRINEEQLQVLREHFHISSPPSDSLIRDISARTGLDIKVIKHWYRNTLFKERQRDKDNPYNFSVPPATTLNLAEYERSGRIEVRETGNENSAHGGRADAVDGGARRKRPLESAAENEGLKRPRLADSPDTKEEAPLTFAQLDRLMAAYKKEAVLSAERAALIGAETGLAAERVAAWFAKARADDCSNLNLLADVAGAAAESIVAVRCPYCDIIFRLRSRLAEHLRGAHQDRPSVDAGALPDGSLRLGMSDSLDARPWLSDADADKANAATPPRRARTSISALQNAVLRYMYAVSKNPGVSDSRKLSDKLGLGRRVVQVWFQNQRAQEKKRTRSSRLSLSAVDYPSSPPADADWLPVDTKVLCRSCASGEAGDSHAFCDDHLDAVVSFVESRLNAEGGQP